LSIVQGIQIMEAGSDIGVGGIVVGASAPAWAPTWRPLWKPRRVTTCCSCGATRCR
jgi:hypothetical protein